MGVVTNIVQDTINDFSGSSAEERNVEGTLRMYVVVKRCDYQLVSY